MTTLWARMLIFNEYKHGNLPKKAAMQFDELLNRCEYSTITKDKLKLSHLNGYYIDCVLGNIGTSRIKNTDNYTFDVIKYIKSSVVDTNYNGDIRRDILANIIGEEFIGLDYEIDNGLKNNIYSEEELQLIKKYLLDTYYVTAANDVSRSARRLIKKISDILHEEYTNLPHVNDNFGQTI